jgi:hypothetical protein
MWTLLRGGRAAGARTARASAVTAAAVMVAVVLVVVARAAGVEPQSSSAPGTSVTEAKVKRVNHGREIGWKFFSKFVKHEKSAYAAWNIFRICLFGEK